MNPPELKLREIALPPLLGLAVFVVASFSMRFPHWTDQTSSLWLATGVSLAALLRTPRPGMAHAGGRERHRDDGGLVLCDE